MLLETADVSGWLSVSTASLAWSALGNAAGAAAFALDPPDPGTAAGAPAKAAADDAGALDKIRPELAAGTAGGGVATAG
jgi:hypothetical protein